MSIYFIDKCILIQHQCQSPTGNDKENGGDGGLSSGAVVGIVIGVIIGTIYVVGSLIIVIWYCKKWIDKNVYWL